MVYKIASPDEYLAITGAGIKTVKITKSAFVLPFQKCQIFSIQPRDYSLNLQAMTKEKLQFLLPVVFTIGPDVNNRGANKRVVDKDSGKKTDGKDEQEGQASEGSKLSEMTKKPAFDRPHPSNEATETTPLIATSQEDGQQGLSENILTAEDKGDALMKYAMLLADGSNKPGVASGTHVDNIVKGIIEGETRVLVSSMTMEQIFSNREHFKAEIRENITQELAQFGLKIYNANVKELGDAPGSSYFESLSRKAHEGAINQARIDVAEAQRKGNVGEAERMGIQNRDIAKINAETAVQKTERDSEKAKAEAMLATRKTAFNRDVSIAQIEATRATESRDEELRKAVEIQRAQTELERLRASDVVKATILRESKQQAADAKNYEEQARAQANLYAEQKGADARAYKVRVEADARVLQEQANSNAAFYAESKKAEAMSVAEKARSDAAVYAGTKKAEIKSVEQKTLTDTAAYNEQKVADANAYRLRVEAEARFLAATKDAEADLIRQQKQAAGLSAMAGAYSDLANAFGGPSGLIQYLMIERNVYTNLAQHNANAVRGMNPKMTIWNTGNQAGGEGSIGEGMGGMNSIRNMYQMLPPLMTTINEQTGVTLPAWQFGKVADQISEREVNGKAVNGMSNGSSSKSDSKSKHYVL